MTTEKEKALIDRARSGDTPAFGELISKYQAMIFNIAYYMTGNVIDAAEPREWERLLLLWLMI